MLSIGAKIEGDLIAGFDKLIEAAGESTLRASGVAGAKVFRDQASANAQASRKTGILQNNIIIKRVEEESDGNKRQTYLVTVRSGKMNTEGDAYYWKWVELGHKVVGKRASKKVSLKAHRIAYEAEFGTSVVPAYPFMRPAYTAKKGAALEAMKQRMAEKINENLGQK